MTLRLDDDGNLIGVNRSINGNWNHRTEVPAAELRAALAEAGLAIVPVEPTQQRYPCGCVTCVCEDEAQCHGCGAKHCGTHPVGHQAASLEGVRVSVEDAREAANWLSAWPYSVEGVEHPAQLADRLRAAIPRQAHSKSEYKRLVAQGVDVLPPKGGDKCPRCDTALVDGQVLAPTTVASPDDLTGPDMRGCTMNEGPGRVVPARKCPRCGFSRTKGGAG